MLFHYNDFPRFWSKVSIGAPDECWPWLGYIRSNGYGRISVSNKMTYVHRLAYELTVGPIPTGLQIDHLCRTRHCVNVRHLEPVTQRVNILRGVSVPAVNSRKTHCKRGHPFDVVNTTFRALDGRRSCRQCDKIRKDNRRALAAERQAAS